MAASNWLSRHQFLFGLQSWDQSSPTEANKQCCTVKLCWKKSVEVWKFCLHAQDAYTVGILKTGWLETLKLWLESRGGEDAFNEHWVANKMVPRQLAEQSTHQQKSDKDCDNCSRTVQQVPCRGQGSNRPSDHWATVLLSLVKGRDRWEKDKSKPICDHRLVQAELHHKS